MKNAVNEMIAELQTESMRDMGNVMKNLNEKFDSQTAGKALGSLVKERLQN